MKALALAIVALALPLYGGDKPADKADAKDAAAVALATQRYNHTTAGAAATSADIRAVIAMDADIRQVLMNSEEARAGREERRSKQTADAVLAARLQVAMACALVMQFVFMALIYRATSKR